MLISTLLHMKYTLIKKQKSAWGLLFSVTLLFWTITTKAQTYVTGGQMTGAPAAGAYYNNSSITINSPFSFIAATGSSLSLYITAPDCVPLNASPSNAQNYIITSIPRIGGIADPSGLVNRSTCDLMQTVQYFDGLGRPLQTVQVKGSPNDKDLVQPMTYDMFGRQVYKYLPYALSTETSDGSYKANALTAGYGVAAFYNPANTSAAQTQLAGAIPHITSPYAQTVFEPSPLNWVTEQGAPGDTWQPNLNSPDLSHTSRVSYAVNDNTDITNIAATFNVMLYKATIGTDGTRTIVNAGTYAPGQLYVSISKDENWQSADLRAGTVQTFKDKAGNVVLKRIFNKKTDGSIEMLSTYYVYDDYGNLDFVLPPGASPDGGTISSNSLDFWCYQYRYDELGRLVEKKLPGKGKEFTVYNKLNQVVMTQDANQRGVANQQWSVIKYDSQGRVAVTGLYTDAGSAAGTEKRTDMQLAVNNNANLWELTVSGGNGYNTSAGLYQTYPKTINTTLAINYYDSYAIPSLPGVFDKHADAGMSTLTTGLPTASLVKVLDGSTGSNTMLWNVTYYDDFGRGIRSFAEHFKGGIVSLNNYDEVKSTYDFTGAVLTSSRVNYINSSSNTLTQSVAVNLSYDYDHMGRKLRTWQGINGNTILLNSVIYNEVGQLAEKNLHSANSGQTFVQSVDYRYNSRGWLKSINNAALNNADPLINNDTNDVFGEELSYDDYATPALKQYNGNISAVNWQGKIQPSGGAAQIVQSYEYSYDKLNRLTLANYTTAGLTGRYNEAITYDAMGNIKKLNRYRDISNTATLIDQLTYLYDNSDNSSKLLSVTDVSGSNEGQLNGTAGYTYDNNGNLWVDNKKGLTFTYNHLNLPYTVTPTAGNALTYIYDANGRKLRKVLSGGNRDYVNGIEYDGSGSITFIQTEEGRARPNGGSSYFYDYALKDHLGNTRVLIGQDGIINQQTDYYAFGMQMNRGSNTVPSPDNKYKYNGKELQDELNMNLYDYGARFYDPVIARWTTPDPLAEESRRWSPYNYAENNPIRNIDPDGMLVTDADGSQHSESLEEAQAMFKQLQAQQQTQDGGKDKKKDDPKAKAAKAAQDKKDKETQEKKDKDSKGSLAGTILLGTLAIDGGLLADDVTGVGVVDDVAIIPVTVVGGATAALTELVDLGIDAYLFFAEHTSGKRKSTEQKHTARRSGKTYDKAQNNKRGAKNQKFKPNPNPNKTGN
jgi:RHS repeat-associated protein